MPVQDTPSSAMSTGDQHVPGETTAMIGNVVDKVAATDAPSGKGHCSMLPRHSSSSSLSGADIGPPPPTTASDRSTLLSEHIADEKLSEKQQESTVLQDPTDNKVVPSNGTAKCPESNGTVFTANPDGAMDKLEVPEEDSGVGGCMAEKDNCDKKLEPCGGDAGDDNINSDSDNNDEEFDFVFELPTLATANVNASHTGPIIIIEPQTTPIAPDGGWGWVIVVVSFLCSAVVDGMCSVFGVLLPDLVVYFDRSSSTVAVAGSLFAGGFLLYGELWSSLTSAARN